ncbi:MAG: winged helix-turn-helix domain-containing protein [Candidatus Helarchaeota archaeon]|nr:winged helix-turn-helix domain-containing protein [Candidatus Helarchaeota archaeon]
MAKGKNESEAVGVLREMEDIKRLFILALLRDGAGQSAIAKAIGVSQSTISKMFPGGIGEITKPKQPK